MNYKIGNIMQYTEVVYYDSDGNEVARERIQDDTWFDESGHLAVSEEELEDYYP